MVARRVTSPGVGSDAAAEFSEAPLVGGALLHPVALTAVAVLLFNDHVLKRAWPGLISGKLSDAAGMVFFPLLLLGLWQLLQKLAGRMPRATLRAVVVCALMTGTVFAATKLSVRAGAAYAWALGAAQWPFRVLAATHPHVAVAPVAHTVDPTDLLVLPLLAVAIAIGRPRTAAR